MFLEAAQGDDWSQSGYGIRQRNDFEEGLPNFAEFDLALQVLIKKRLYSFASNLPSDQSHFELASS